MFVFLPIDDIKGYFFADIVVFYMVPLLLSCILYGLIARVLYTDYFKKCPELCRHSNQASVDTNKSSRVQVTKIYCLLSLKFILDGRLLLRKDWYYKMLALLRYYNCLNSIPVIYTFALQLYKGENIYTSFREYQF